MDFMHKVKYYPVPKQVLNVLLPKHMYASFIEDAPDGWDAYLQTRGITTRKQ